MRLYYFKIINKIIKSIVNMFKSKEYELFVFKVDGRYIGIFKSCLRYNMYKNGYLQGLSEHNVIKDYNYKETSYKDGDYIYNVGNVELIKKVEEKK